MRCEACHEMMLAYVKGQLPGEDIRPFEEHVGQCTDCAGELTGVRRVLGLVEAADEPPMWRLLETIIASAVEHGASDIHVEAPADHLNIRYRIDGVLHDVMSVPNNVHDPLVARIKMLAGLDVGERLAPQTARMTLEREEGPVDFRVTTVPSIAGEKVVMRLWTPKEKPVGLGDIGLAEDNAAKLEAMLKSPTGLFVVSGPIGSGKTTTAYACLTELSHEGVSLMSVEDPVAMVVPGVTQIDVNRRAGVDYAEAMRTVLMADPDIIFCGNIDDAATARICLDASLTGHLLIGTVHSQDAPTTLRRLVDLDVPPYLLADALIGVLNQRLARLVCDDCRQTREPTEDEWQWLSSTGIDDPPAEVAYGEGCEKCKKTGCKGRTSLHEVLQVDDGMRELLVSGGDVDSLVAAARERVVPMRLDGARKVVAGRVSIEEAMRILGRSDKRA